MTVSTTTNRTELQGNGTLTGYNAGFTILTDADIEVYVAGVKKNLTSDFTVSNAGTSTPAAVAFTSGSYPSPGASLASSVSVLLVRTLTLTQPSNYQNNDIFDAETLEGSLDRATQQIQQTNNSIDRAFHFTTDVTGITTSTTGLNQSVDNRKSKYLGFNASGNIDVITSITGLTYSETSIAEGHILRYLGSAWINSNILALDDTKLYFGTDSNISLEYDENGNDTLSFDGGDLLIEDEHNLFFGSNKDVGLYYNEASSDCLNINGEVLVEDDHKLYFGTNKDVSIEYDEAGLDTLLFQSLTGVALNIGLYSDAGEDNADKWKISVADGGTMTFESYISGSWVAMMTLAPNATATDSAITLAGDLTVSGDTTTVDTANLLVEDPLIVLQKSVTGTPANDCGLIIERGSSNNVAIIWDESEDEFAFLSNTSETGSGTGNMNMGAYGSIHTTDITADGDITMATNKKVKQKGEFLQHSLHRSLVIG